MQVDMVRLMHSAPVSSSSPSPSPSPSSSSLARRARRARTPPLGRLVERRLGRLRSGGRRRAHGSCERTALVVGTCAGACAVAIAGGGTTVGHHARVGRAGVSGRSHASLVRSRASAPSPSGAASEDDEDAADVEGTTDAGGGGGSGDSGGNVGGKGTSELPPEDDDNDGDDEENREMGQSSSGAGASVVTSVLVIAVAMGAAIGASGAAAAGTLAGMELKSSPLSRGLVAFFCSLTGILLAMPTIDKRAFRATPFPAHERKTANVCAHARSPRDPGTRTLLISLKFVELIDDRLT